MFYNETAEEYEQYMCLIYFPDCLYFVYTTPNMFKFGFVSLISQRKKKNQTCYMYIQFYIKVINVKNLIKQNTQMYIIFYLKKNSTYEIHVRLYLRHTYNMYRAVYIYSIT